MATIPRYPNTMPKESHKWLPKFTGNNVITPKENLDDIGVAMKCNGIEHEDVVMKLLVMSLDEDVKKWYKVFPNNHWASYEYFAKLFKGRWTTKKDNKILLIQFNQIKKRENKIVKEFDPIFENLHSQIPKELRLPEADILLLYLNSFEVQFGFIMKKKMPKIWQSPKSIVHRLKNILSAQILMFFSSLVSKHNRI
jgi:hypothetical protein